MRESISSKFPPNYVASSLLLKLATRLFNRIHCNGCLVSEREELLRDWATLRTLGHQFLLSGSTKMLPVQRAALNEALAVAHNLAHDYDVSTWRDIPNCSCECAGEIEDLEVLLFLEDALPRLQVTR